MQKQSFCKARTVYQNYTKISLPIALQSVSKTQKVIAKHQLQKIAQLLVAQRSCATRSCASEVFA